jgi:glycosyltransferase involved in cell wall biosynthesis
MLTSNVANSAMNTFFSAIIPTHNRARKVARAVESVLAQTDRDVECIVVDDGSTDDTARTLAAYGEAITVVSQENGGVSAARNAGIDRSRGQYLAFLDSDDWWYPEKLATIRTLLSRHPEAVLAYSPMDVVDEWGATIGNTAYAVGRDLTFRDLLNGNPIGASTAVVRREVAIAAGGFSKDINGCEDWELWLKVARLGALRHCKRTLVAYEAMNGDSYSAAVDRLCRNRHILATRMISDSAYLSDGDGRALRASVELVNGSHYLAVGQKASARRCFLKALAANPTDLRAGWWYGLSLIPDGARERLVSTLHGLLGACRRAKMER